MLLQRSVVARDRSGRTRTGARAPQDASVRPYVMGEEVFRGVAIRERQRTDRSNQPFVLLLVSAKVNSGNVPSSAWAAVTAALAAAKRESDILGWFQLGSILALILTEIRTISPPAAQEIEARVRREVARRVDAEALSGFSVRLYVQPTSDDAAGGIVPPADPVLAQRWSLGVRPSFHDSVKRTLDIVGSLILLLVLAPAFFFIAVIVRLTSRGPSFFRQIRVGEMAASF